MEIDEYLKEFVIDNINNGCELDIEEISTHFEGDEMNFNNADTTSGQKCYEYGEIKDMVSLIISELSKEDDRCPNCCKFLDDEEGYKVVYEKRDEYGGREAVVLGIRCIHCGFEEDY